jgi:hypothetical protein
MEFKGNWTAKINKNNFENAIKEIVDNSGSFSTFKKNSHYNSVVGCDTMEDFAGLVLSDEIKTKYNQILGDLNKFRENDKFGTPIVYKTILGDFSPNTLRYMVVLGEIEEHFGSLEGKDIIEIGSAYGGQCFIVSRRHKFNSYTLIDIPPAVELSKQYLSLFDDVGNVIYEDTNNIISKESDLVISNFALTELNEAGWDFYIDTILSKTKNFYIITNIADKYQYGVLFKKLLKYFKILWRPEPELKKNGTGVWIGEKL